MAVSNVSRSEEPHDRMTRLCGVMTRALEADPEYTPGIQGFIMLRHGEHGGTVTFGFEDHATALSTMMSHTEATAKAYGFNLQYVPTPAIGEG